MSFQDFSKKLLDKLKDKIIEIIVTAVSPLGPWLLGRIPQLKPYLEWPIPFWVLLSIALPLCFTTILLYRSLRIRTPKGTLRFASKPEGNCRWSMGTYGGKPAMQINGSMFVTNIASTPGRITQVCLRCGFLGQKQVLGAAVVEREARGNMYGLYDIPPNETRNLHFDFWVCPPVIEADKDFIPHSIIFLDQWGNEHKIQNVVFNSLQTKTPSGPRPEEPKEPEEFPYQISSPIEKEVVSVLKSELAQYQRCGRIVGGLGSIHIVYKTQTFKGVEGDVGMPNSPVNKQIVDDPENAVLRSDNLEALLSFYGQMNLDEERAQFAQALLDRLDAKRGYLGISYFIVCVLWKIGRLDDALKKARQDLPEKEHKVWGLNHVLMLLNSLLRFRHPDFTSQMLDQIEQMTHGLSEDTFQIPAKIAAIRTSRLKKTVAEF